MHMFLLSQTQTYSMSLVRPHSFISVTTMKCLFLKENTLGSDNAPEMCPRPYLRHTATDNSDSFGNSHAVGYITFYEKNIPQWHLEGAERGQGPSIKVRWHDYNDQSLVSFEWKKGSFVCSRALQQGQADDNQILRLMVLPTGSRNATPRLGFYWCSPSQYAARITFILHFIAYYPVECSSSWSPRCEI